MVRYKLVAFGIAGMLLTSCSVIKHKNKPITGHWPQQPVVVDGLAGEWPAVSGYDDKAMLGYSCSNDSADLYIRIETGDAATQLKILKNGLTVWLDRTGKEQQITAINYPIPENFKLAGDKGIRTQRINDNADPGPDEAIQKRLLDIRMNVKQAIPQAAEYSLQGFKGCNFQFPLTAGNSCGIVVRMNMNEDNQLVWEACIPFKAFYHKEVIDRTDRNRIFSICIETTEAKRPAGQTTARVRGNARSGFRPGISVGGMGMGMQFGGGNGSYNTAYDPNANLMEPLYRSTNTWFRTNLAIK